MHPWQGLCMQTLSAHGCTQTVSALRPCWMQTEATRTMSSQAACFCKVGLGACFLVSCPVVRHCPSSDAGPRPQPTPAQRTTR